MTSRYLIRIDDACPSMDYELWSRLELIFDRLNIHPVVAVVPDNHDPVLQVDAPDPEFWDRVRAWQAKGWTIAMHGYQHRYHHIDRRKLILPYYDHSEFAGLSLKEQSEKIRASWDIFRREDVTPDVWIAPAHCFDAVTLEALRNETPIRIISDGIARNCFEAFEFFWVPQQLWSLAPRTSGIWTLCLHPNGMSHEQIDNLGKQLSLKYYRERTVSMADVKRIRRRLSISDQLYARVFWGRISALKVAFALRQRFMSLFGEHSFS